MSAVVLMNALCVFADSDDSKADLQPIDVIVIVAVVLFIFAGAFVLLKTMCTKVRW